MYLQKLLNAPLALTYDDVLLVPKKSNIKTRKSVNISTTVCGIKLRVPVISANMDTITWVKMAEAMYLAGGMGILHRYEAVSDTIKAVKHLRNNYVPAIPSIGIKGTDDRVNPESAAKLAGMYRQVGADAVCLDIAHAHTDYVLRCTELIAKYDIPVIVGNIATYEAGYALVNAGASALKVGIGPGSVCSTREVTGHGYPQLSAVAAVSDLKTKFDISVIADGGIKTCGDILKALAAGADAIMSGFLFASCPEAPVQHIYRGMASRQARETVATVDRDYLEEGIATEIVVKPSVIDIVKKLSWGIKSGFSYSGACDLDEFRANSTFVRVTAQGQLENATRV